MSLLADTIREFEKTLDVLEQCERHFSAEAEMNAALHMSNTVRPAPLAAAVATARMQVSNYILFLKMELKKEDIS